MADETEFSTYNIDPDEEITQTTRDRARQHFQDAFAHNYDTDNKTEFVDRNGASISKPDYDDWKNQVEEANQLAMLGMGSGRYADLGDKMKAADNFFATATADEIRAALTPPNDMGSYAQSIYKDLMLEKNEEDARFERNLSPKGGDASAPDGQAVQDIAGDVDELFGEGAEYLKKMAAEAKKLAEEQTNAAVASIQPAKSVEFKQQNFLQAKLLDIVRHRNKVGADKLPPPGKTYPYVDGSPNASIMVHGDPATIVNDLFVYPDTEVFFRMESDEIASLQPEIRFFKSVTDGETGKEINIPIHFDTHFTQNSLESLLSSKKKRGSGVGLQELKLSFVGVDVFSANKAFKASVKIFANSFEELFQPRGYRGLRYRYVDMAMKTGTKADISAQSRVNAKREGVLDEDLSRLDFGIKLKIGVREPNKMVRQTNSALKKALGRNSITLHMIPTIHKFNFNSDGTVVMEIDYRPYKDHKLSGKNFDVFTNTATLKNEIDFLVKSKMHKENCDAEGLDQLKKDYMDEVKTTRRDAIASIIENLHSQSKVNYLQIHPEVLEKFHTSVEELSMEQIFELSKGAEFVGREGEELKEKIKKDLGKTQPEDPVKKKVNSPTINTVSYVYLSDVIDAVMASITKSLSQQELSSVAGASSADAQQSVKDANEQLKKTEEDVIHLMKGEGIRGASAQDLLDFATAKKVDGETAGMLEQAQERLTKAETAAKEQTRIMEIGDELIKDFKQDFEDFRKFRVVLGPVELVNPFNQEDVLICSLGDLPIALPYFQEWLVSETLKNDSRRLPLSSFLNKMIKKVIASSLNDDSMFGGALKQKVRLAQTEVKCINQYEDQTDDLTHLMLAADKSLKDNYASWLKTKFGFDGLMDSWGSMESGEKEKVISSMGVVPASGRIYINEWPHPVCDPAAMGEDPLKPKSAEREMDYLVFFQNRTAPIGSYIGNRTMDLDAGIHHYSIGRDRGIIKDIKLTRDNRKGIQEARYEQHGFVGLSQLGMVYSVDIDSYANFNVFPGTTIFVDPTGWVPNLDSETLGELGSIQALTSFGLGGYYCVIGVDHTFGPGTFDSQIKAKWVMEIDSPERRERISKMKKPSKQDNNKCKTKSKDTIKKSTPGSEVGQLASRIKALARTSLSEISDAIGASSLEEAGEKIASLMGRPSKAP